MKKYTLVKMYLISYYDLMGIESINALEKVIKEENLLKKHNLDKIGVFGSFARGEKANDIDFYIDIEDYRVKNLITHLTQKHDFEYFRITYKMRS